MSDEIKELIQDITEKVNTPGFWLLAFCLETIPAFRNSLLKIIYSAGKQPATFLMNFENVITCLLASYLVVLSVVSLVQIIFTVKHDITMKVFNAFERYISIVISPVFLWFQLLMNAKFIDTLVRMYGQGLPSIRNVFFYSVAICDVAQLVLVFFAFINDSSNA